MLTKLECPFEVKAVDEAGNFEGYASVFNNIDLGDDIIIPGAFTKVKTTRQGRLKLALFHDLTRLVGSAEYMQDDHGLFLKGQINLKVSYARDAYELMKDGTLDSMSIGFNTITEAYEQRSGRNVRVIKEAELWEASIVPFGMNPEAQVMNVKSDMRAFEAAVASHGFSALHRDGDRAATEIVDELKAVSQLFTSHFGAI